MRPPTSLHEKHIGGPQNFQPPVQNDFCNRIGHKRTHALQQMPRDSLGQFCHWTCFAAMRRQQQDFPNVEGAGRVVAHSSSPSDLPEPRAMRRSQVTPRSHSRAGCAGQPL